STPRTSGAIWRSISSSSAACPSSRKASAARRARRICSGSCRRLRGSAPTWIIASASVRSWRARPRSPSAWSNSISACAHFEIDLRVGVGFDGRIRSFQAIERRENRSNAFYTTPLGRLWAYLSLLLSGVRATPGEVLSRLVDGVFSELEAQVIFFFQLIGDIE